MKELKEYINVSISLREEYYDNVFAMLMDFDIMGVEEKLDEIVISYAKELWNEQEKQRLLDTIRLFDTSAEIISEEHLVDKNWEEEWKKHIEAVSISDRVGIAPGCKLTDLDNEIKIIINPKMSFGTGQHESTRLVCRLMEKYVKPGTKWLDAGTGSGALAVLAAKLGTSHVLAFDNNEWAIENASENFILNGVQSQVKLEKLDLDEDILLPDADGITANLFFKMIMSSYPIFFKSLKEKKGILIISGIMKYNEEETVDKALETGFELIEIIYENEWLGAAFRVK